MAFRVSPEEDSQIETAVKLTGLTKQDYIIRRLLCRDVVVQGNPRVYKALRDQLAAVLDELHRIEAGQGVNEELLDTIQMITTIMKGMQEDSLYSRSTIFRGAVRIFRCLYSEAIYIATIIDCLPGVVIMYLKKQYVFVLDMGAKSK